MEGGLFPADFLSVFGELYHKGKALPGVLRRIYPYCGYYGSLHICFCIHRTRKADCGDLWWRVPCTDRFSGKLE